MEANTIGLKIRIILAVAITLLLAVGGLWAQRSASNDGVAQIQSELFNHNKNDGKDNCPNDGNAGKGNDNKGPNGGCRPHPPTGGYGVVPGP